MQINTPQLFRRVDENITIIYYPDNTKYPRRDKDSGETGRRYNYTYGDNAVYGTHVDHERGHFPCKQCIEYARRKPERLTCCHMPHPTHENALMKYRFGPSSKDAANSDEKIDDGSDDEMSNDENSDLDSNSALTTPFLLLRN